MNELTLEQVEVIVNVMAKTAIDNEAYFSDLDGVMGDADFGTSLAGGFRAVLAGFAGFDRSSMSALLLKVSSAITSSTGGCSGPVWGTLFMRFGMAFKGKTAVVLPDVIAGFDSAIEGIMKRGGAELGDKTLVDALHEIRLSLKTSDEQGIPLLEAFDRAAKAAVECRETTKPWVAKRGRQSFTGERSRDTYDPGIVAVGEMATAIAAALNVCRCEQT